MSLTKYERETIVNFNELEDVGYIFTYRKDWQRKLETMGFTPDYTNSHGGKEYTVPKSLVVKPPHKPRKLSNQQKEELRQRMRQTSILKRKTPVRVGKSGGEDGSQ